MSRYVKCRKKDTYFKDDLAQTFADLAVGQVYKQTRSCWRSSDVGRSNQTGQDGAEKEVSRNVVSRWAL